MIHTLAERQLNDGNNRFGLWISSWTERSLSIHVLMISAVFAFFSSLVSRSQFALVDAKCNKFTISNINQSETFRLIFFFCFTCCSIYIERTLDLWAEQMVTSKHDSSLTIQLSTLLNSKSSNIVLMECENKQPADFAKSIYIEKNVRHLRLSFSIFFKHNKRIFHHK